MGYSVQMFTDIGKLKLPSNKVLDIGAQDLIIPSINELTELNTFISIKNPKNIISISSFPAKLEAKEVYERAGYEYTNIDVDERPETVRVDLAAFDIPRPRNKYGLVVNVGTTEHLSSPVATFALMHELVCVNGFIYNDVPLFGFGNHGLINPTPKFWHALVWMNQYQPVTVKVRKVDEDSVGDKGNFYHDYLNYIEGLSEISGITYLINCIFKKNKSAIFVPPFDAVFPDSDNGYSLAKLLAGSYYPFVCTGAYTVDEAKRAINDFLMLNQRKYRVTDYYSLVADMNCKTSKSSVQNRHSLIKRLKMKYLKYNITALNNIEK